MRTVTSREFNQDTSAVKRAAREGPVTITDRGRASHVLMSIEDYRKLTGESPSLADLLSCPEAAEIEFDPPKATFGLRPAEFD